MINEFNKDLYKTDWRWYEDGYEVTRTSGLDRPWLPQRAAAFLPTSKTASSSAIEGDPNFAYNAGPSVPALPQHGRGDLQPRPPQVAAAPRRRKRRQQVEARHVGRGLSTGIEDAYADDLRHHSQSSTAESGPRASSPFPAPAATPCGTAPWCLRAAFGSARTCPSASSRPTPAISPA